MTGFELVGSQDVPLPGQSVDRRAVFGLAPVDDPAPASWTHQWYGRRNVAWARSDLLTGGADDRLVAGQGDGDRPCSAGRRMGEDAPWCAWSPPRAGPQTSRRYPHGPGSTHHLSNGPRTWGAWPLVAGRWGAQAGRMNLALLIAAEAGLVGCVLALAVSLRDRALPLAWWQGASVLLLVGALGWTVAAILSPERRLFYAALATGLLLPPAIWIVTKRPKRRHTEG
jgi:hypothetical protein